MYTGHIQIDTRAHIHVLRCMCAHMHMNAHTDTDTQAHLRRSLGLSRCRSPYLGGNEMSSSYSLSLKTDNSLSNSKS